MVGVIPMTVVILSTTSTLMAALGMPNAKLVGALALNNW